MSEFHTSKDAIDAYNNMEQIYGHTDDRCSKDADLIADDILDWLATINAATFDQSNQEILDRMLAQLDAATPSIDNCDVESSLKAFHKKYAMLFENATAEAGRKILCKRFSTKVKNGAGKQSGFWPESLEHRKPWRSERYARRVGVNAGLAAVAY